MNALKSIMEATARVHRDGVEAEIPAEQLVVGAALSSHAR
jgi:Ca2+-transporting ATPase